MIQTLKALKKFLVYLTALALTINKKQYDRQQQREENAHVKASTLIGKSEEAHEKALVRAAIARQDVQRKVAQERIKVVNDVRKKSAKLNDIMLELENL